MAKKRNISKTTWRLSSATIPESGWVEITKTDEEDNVLETVKLNMANVLYTSTKPETDYVSICIIGKTFKVQLSQ